jgi:8-amino-7-oxononanoate synthase
MPSEAQNQLERELQAALDRLRERSQLRTFSEAGGVDLSSNDYLGLAADPRLKQAAIEAVSQAPRTGGTGSRLLSGHHPVWNELEEQFADFAGTEAALYFANGYAANLGLLAALAGKDDLVFSDALNHASLIDGIRLSGARRVIYPHLDLDVLERALGAHRQEPCRKWIVTESVFSMDGDIADVKSLCELGARFGASLILDEAHATAVHGPGGKGVVAGAGLAPEVFAVVHTCGKALASAGGFVCGSRVLRDFLINHARTLIFSTAMPPYMAGQIRAALRLAGGMDDERERLLGNSLDFARALREDGWDLSGTASQIVPVIVGGNAEALSAAEALAASGFAARAIRPPTVPTGSARLRLSLTTRIEAPELLRLRSSLRSWRSARLSFHSAGAR